jgi:hypothetical protein
VLLGYQALDARGDALVVHSRNASER